LEDKINGLIRAGRIGAASHLARAFAAIAPEDPGVDRTAATVLLHSVGPEAGAEKLEQALLRRPAEHSFHRMLSAIRLDQGRSTDALYHAAEAVCLAPSDHHAKSLLGMALSDLGRVDEALSCLEDAFASGSNDSVTQNSLFKVRLCSLIMSDQWRPAVALAERLSCEFADDPTFLNLSAHAMARCDDWSHAADLWRVASAKSVSRRSDAWAAHMLLCAERRAPARCYPGLPPTEAQHSNLAALASGTIIPGRLAAVLDLWNISGGILDLQCGTGLNAIAASSPTRTFYGVEPKTELANQARGSGVFASLDCADPLPYISRSDRTWQAIITGYLAFELVDLAPLFQSAADSLGQGGVISMAILLSDTNVKGGCLGPFGWYEHALDDVIGAAEAAHLSTDLSAPSILFTTLDLPVHGRILSLRHRS
jgi:tetratricopeptide (TPR) repeat protein